MDRQEPGLGRDVLPAPGKDARGAPALLRLSVFRLFTLHWTEANVLPADLRHLAPPNKTRFYFRDVSNELRDKLLRRFVDALLPLGSVAKLRAGGKAPDHSALSLFKERLLEGGGNRAFEGLFNEIIKIVQEKGGEIWTGAGSR